MHAPVDGDKSLAWMGSVQRQELSDEETSSLLQAPQRCTASQMQFYTAVALPTLALMLPGDMLQHVDMHVIQH